MDFALLIPYLFVGLLALLESGELTIAFAGVLLYLDVVSFEASIYTLVCALIGSDLLWYRFGYAVYEIPFIHRLEGRFKRLDTHIRAHPLGIAMLARFTYGVHRLTLARYRHNGISFSRMLIISLATTLPWLVFVGTIVIELKQAVPWVASVFRFAELLLVVAFVLLFIVEIGLTAYIRKVRNVLNETLLDFLAPPTAWARRFVILYGVALFILFVLLVGTPLFVHSDVLFLTEERAEAFVLALLSVTGFLVYRAYAEQLRILEERYHSMTRHVGALNLQTVQVEALFNQLVRIPENKRDFIRMLESLNANILGAVPVPWVLTRIIDIHTGQTLTEHHSVRGDLDDGAHNMSLPVIGNATLLSGGKIKQCRIYRSNQRNTSIRVVCVVPAGGLNHHQDVVITVAVNSIALLYLIYTSQSFQKRP